MKTITLEDFVDSGIFIEGNLHEKIFYHIEKIRKPISCTLS